MKINDVDFETYFKNFSRTVSKCGLTLEKNHEICYYNKIRGRYKMSKLVDGYFEYIESYFENLQGRLIMSLYSQNLFRIIEVLELAKKYKHKVFFYNKEHVKLLKQVEELLDGVYKQKEYLNEKYQV